MRELSVPFQKGLLKGLRSFIPSSPGEELLTECHNWSPSETGLIPYEKICGIDFAPSILTLTELAVSFVDSDDSLAIAVNPALHGCEFVLSVPALAANLVHCWDFEEVSGNLLDHVGTEHLTRINNPLLAAGYHLQGLQLVRSSSQAASSNTIPGDMNFASAFTICFRLKLNSIPAGSMAVFSHAGSLSAGQYDYWGIITSAAAGKFQVAFGQGFGGVITHNTALVVGNWNFIGISHSSTELRMLVNSEAFDSQTVGLGTAPSVSAPFSFGSTNSNGNFLDGILDSPMIFNRALTDVELIQIRDETL